MRNILILSIFSLISLTNKTNIIAQGGASGRGSGPTGVADQVRGCQNNSVVKKDCIRQFCEFKEQTYKELAYVFTQAQVDEVCRLLTSDNNNPPTATPTKKPAPVYSPSPIPEITAVLSPSPSPIAIQSTAPQKPASVFQKIINFFTNFFSKIFG